jgi:hypothetical protein
MIGCPSGLSVGRGSRIRRNERRAVIETYCMLGREREAELLREARRLHALGPSTLARVTRRLAHLVRSGYPIDPVTRTPPRVRVADSE